MKAMKFWIVLGLVATLAGSALALSPVHMNNRLRLGYDDNIYQVGEPTGSVLSKKDSWRIIEEIETLVSLNLERAYLGLRYRPTVIWYENRENDQVDFLNDLDLNFIHNFTPTLALSLNDTLKANQLPELQDENYIVRQNDDNYYNSAVATLAYQVRPTTRLDLSGRHIMLVYDSDSPSKKNSDYYSLVGGLTLRQQLASRTTLLGDLRYQSVTYNKADEADKRDADSIFAGVGAEQSFSPQMIGSARAGLESRSYENERYDDNNQPYGEVSVTYLPTPASRITVAASYSIYESDVERYMSQNRTYFSLSLAHDFTAKLSFYLSGAYSLNAYEADYALDPTLPDADETSYLVSARLAYRLNRINWLETGYQFVKFDSEVPRRESYERNRFDIGWKIQLF